MQLRRSRFIPLSIAAVFVALLTVIGFQATAGAASVFRSGNDVTVSSGETIESTLYASGSTLEIDGRINGDLFCAGQTVTVSGTIEGDVLCAAQNIRITGTVNGDVRLAAQSAAVEGDVNGNASMMAQTVSVTGSGSVSGDLGGLAQNTTVNGNIGRDLAISSSLITVNAPVGRDVTAQTGELTLGDAARVNGDVIYTSSNDLQRDDGATVNGEVRRQDARETAAGPGDYLGFLLFMLAALLVISMALVLVMPLLFQRASNAVLTQPGKAALVGLILHIGVPVLLLALSLTIIGLPLAIIVGLAWLLILALSGPAAAYLLGRVILRNNSNAIVIMLVGSLVLLLLYLIPFVNFLAFIAVALFGTGGLALAAPRWRHHGYEVRPTTEVIEARPKSTHRRQHRDQADR